MTLDSMQQFKETVLASETIAVQTGTTNDPSKILAAHLLHALFLSLGKKSIFRSPALDDRIKTFAHTLLPVPPHATSHEENLLIKIDTDKLPVAELTYEKEGSLLKIILRGKEALDTKHVVIEKEKAPVGLLVLVDPHDGEVESLLAAVPHKDVVRLTSKTKSLIHKVVGVIEMLRGELHKDFANALWALALSEEKQYAVSPELLTLKTRLLEMNANRHLVATASEALNGAGFWKLMGRALARSEFEKDLGIVWTFIPHADFQKAQYPSEHVFPLFDELRYLRPEGGFLALLWEKSPKSISALIGGNNIEKTRELALEMGSSLASSYFLLEGFATFSEVEIKIRSGIRKMLQ